MQPPPLDREFDDDVLEQLIDEFVEKLRSGKSPNVDSFAQRYPSHYESIKETLEALEVLERFAPTEGSNPHPLAGSPARALPQSRCLGDFLILQEIGRGGMGIVYEAEQLSLGRRVALKLIPQSVSNSSSISARFKREAKAAAKLHHTNIVPVFGVGADEGCEYYVMQYIRGESLDRVLKELRTINSGAVTSGRKDTSKGNQSSTSRLATGSPEGNEPVADVGTAPTEVIPQVTQVANVLLSGTRVHRVNDPTEASPITSAEEPGRLDAPLFASTIHGTARSHTDVTGSLSASGLNLSESGLNRTEHGTSYWHSVGKIGAQIASALAYAHQQGVLHRDIKPANILLDLHGIAWLTDFGLAKLQDDSNLTTTGDLVGTLRYMAPENFRGVYDERSDLFCLGLTLYEMCTLRPAYCQSERRSLIDHVSQGNFVKLESCNARVPVDLRTIIHKCLEIEPEHRYADASALEADLRSFLAGEPIRARRVSLLERLSRWSRRNKQLAFAFLALGVTICMLAIGGPIMAAYMAQVARQSKRIASENEQLVKLAEEERNRVIAAKGLAEQSRDRAIHVAYSAAMSRAADNALKGGNSAVTDRLVNAWRFSGMLTDPKQWEWHWLRSHQHAEKHLIFGHHADVRCVAFQPRGKLLATAGVSEGVRIYDRETGKEQYYIPQNLSVVVEWSTDGSQLLLQSADYEVAIFNVATQQITRFPFKREPPHDVRWLDWHPSNSHVAVAINNTVEIHDATSWDLVAKREGLPERDAEARTVLVHWSPNGDRVAWCVEGQVILLNSKLEELCRSENQDSQVVALCWQSPEQLIALYRSGSMLRIRTSDGEIVDRQQLQNTSPVNGADWNRDGSQVATAHDEQLMISDVATGRMEKTFDTYGSQFRFYMRNVSWSDDDRYLSVAFQGMSAPVPIWDLTEPHTRVLPNAVNAQNIDLMPGPVNMFSWSSDGEKLASLNDGIQIWDMKNKSIERRFEIPNERRFYFDSKDIPLLARDVQFSPDGKYLAATHYKVFVWELETGQLIYEGTPELREYRSVSWSSDSRYLAIATSLESPIQVWDSQTRSLSTTPDTQHDFCSFVNWHPSKPWLLFNSKQQSMCWNYETQSPAWSVSNGLSHESLPRWSRKGDRFATNARSNCILIVDADSRARITLDGHIELVRSLSWNARDSRLASVDRNGLAIVWDTERGAEVMRLYQDAICCQWSPTAPVLAVARKNGNIDLLDATKSYRDELPPEENNGLIRELQTNLEKSFYLARRNQWSQIESLAKDKPLMVGWWSPRFAEVGQAIATGESTDPATVINSLQWMQPVDPDNGIVVCQPGVTTMVCPIYAPEAMDVQVLAGLNLRIDAYRLNGREFRFPDAEDGSLRQFPAKLEMGWNWLSIETKDVLRSEFVFFQLNLDH